MINISCRMITISHVFGLIFICAPVIGCGRGASLRIKGVPRDVSPEDFPEDIDLSNLAGNEQILVDRKLIRKIRPPAPPQPDPQTDPKRVGGPSLIQPPLTPLPPSISSLPPLEIKGPSSEIDLNVKANEHFESHLPSLPTTTLLISKGQVATRTSEIPRSPTSTSPTPTSPISTFSIPPSPESTSPIPTTTSTSSTTSLPVFIVRGDDSDIIKTKTKVIDEKNSKNSENSISTASTVQPSTTVAETELVQHIPQEDSVCRVPFNKVPDRTISSLSQIYRTSMEAKVDSSQVCSFLCLQRAGACHAFAFDHSKTLCRIFGTGITVLDLTIAPGIDFFYMKEECVLAGPLLTVQLGGGEEKTFGKPIQGPILVEPMDFLVIERTPGFQQLGFGLVYEPYSEQQCIEFCKTDSTPTGMSRNCLAADHNHQHSRCFLMTDDEKRGSLEKPPELYPSPDFVHFRKLFLSQRAADACVNHVTAYPQRALVGYDQETMDAPNYGACIQRCLQLGSEKNLCKSGSYYAKESTSNCVLSFEDDISKPKSFIEVNSDELLVEYFSIRTCQLSVDEKRHRYLRRYR